MFNKNQLGHDLYCDDRFTHPNSLFLICRRCNSCFTYYKDSGYYYLLGLELGCDEMIIKNIIE